MLDRDIYMFESAIFFIVFTCIYAVVVFNINVQNFYYLLLISVCKIYSDLRKLYCTAMFELFSRLFLRYSKKSFTKSFTGKLYITLL